MYFIIFLESDLVDDKSEPRFECLVVSFQVVSHTVDPVEDCAVSVSGQPANLRKPHVMNPIKDMPVAEPCRCHRLKPSPGEELCFSDVKCAAHSANDALKLLVALEHQRVFLV